MTRNHIYTPFYISLGIHHWSTTTLQTTTHNPINSKSKLSLNWIWNRNPPHPIRSQPEHLHTYIPTKTPHTSSLLPTIPHPEKRTSCTYQPEIYFFLCSFFLNMFVDSNCEYKYIYIFLNICILCPGIEIWDFGFRWFWGKGGEWKNGSKNWIFLKFP